MGTLSSDTWGADNVIPRYVENGLEDMEWPRSLVVHAVADDPDAPATVHVQAEDFRAFSRN